MSNEHHDVAEEAEGGTIGIAALHVLAPDEVLADVPFSQWGAGAAASSAEAGHGEDVARCVGVSRDALLMAITTQCFEGGASLLEAGMRFCAMSSRAGLPVPMNANERRKLRAVVLGCNGSLWLPRCDEAAGVFELLQGSESRPVMIGRRLSLMAYAFNRGPVIRRVLPNMETIGRLWGLRAKNKRSAVCAAMDKLKSELLRWGWMRGHMHQRSMQFWFEKSEEAKAAYEVAQKGNANRLGTEEPEPCDVLERLHGFPVKKEFRGLKPEELRRRLEALAGRG